MDAIDKVISMIWQETEPERIPYFLITKDINQHLEALDFRKVIIRFFLSHGSSSNSEFLFATFSHWKDLQRKDWDYIFQAIKGNILAEYYMATFAARYLGVYLEYESTKGVSITSISVGKNPIESGKPALFIGKASGGHLDFDRQIFGAYGLGVDDFRALKLKLEPMTPIEHPTSLLMKIAFWVSKRQYGKVISPLKMIYARRPALMFFGKKILDTEKKLKLAKSDKLLIRNYVSNVNNCSFCKDLSKYEAAKNSIEGQKMIELLNFRASENFSPKEKAMLSYVDEVSTIKQASEATMAALAKHYSEGEIIDITWICATEHYFNLMAKPLGIGSDDLMNQ